MLGVFFASPRDDPSLNIAIREATIKSCDELVPAQDHLSKAQGRVNACQAELHNERQTRQNLQKMLQDLLREEIDKLEGWTSEFESMLAAMAPSNSEDSLHSPDGIGDEAVEVQNGQTLIVNDTNRASRLEEPRAVVVVPSPGGPEESCKREVKTESESELDVAAMFEGVERWMRNISATTDEHERENEIENENGT